MMVSGYTLSMDSRNKKQKKAAAEVVVEEAETPVVEVFTAEEVEPAALESDAKDDSGVAVVQLSPEHGDAVPAPQNVPEGVKLDVCGVQMHPASLAEGLHDTSGR